MNIVARYFVLFLLFFLLQSLYAQPEESPRVSLDPVNVIAGENPAHRIINLAVKNREKNSPFHNRSFKCVIYNKTYFSSPILEDTLIRDLGDRNIDSLSNKQLQELTYYRFFNRQHLFLSESVFEKLYKRSTAMEYERIIASKTSGVQDPIFSILLTKTQSFSFYESDFVTVIQTRFLNPVSRGSVTKYIFTIQDTLYEGKDTLFVISFQPKKNAVFQGLQGTLHITSDQYAIRQVIAEPHDKVNNFPVKISHDYEKQASGTWFPKEIRAEVMLGNLVKDCPVIGYSTSTIREIEIDIPLRNRDFGILDVEDDIHSLRSNAYFLRKYRNDPIESKDFLTYLILDSLGKELRVNQILSFLKTVLLGSIPLGPLDLDLKSIVDFNNLEGFRFGLGLYTNKRLTPYLSFGGYFAYGVKDNHWKWGAKANLFLYRPRELVLKLNYAFDLVESGRIELFDRQYTIFAGEFYRRWLLSKFDRSNSFSAGLEMRLTRFLRGMVMTKYSQNETRFNYGFEMPLPRNDEFHPYTYNAFEIRAGLRFAFKETYFKAGDLYFLDRSPYPVVTIQYTRGIKDVFQSTFTYDKFDFKLYYKQNYKRLGYTEISLMAGFTDASLPYSLLYSSAGGYDVVGFYGKEQFGVMRSNEFMSSAYTSLFLRHNFGKMTGNKKYSPHIILCQNIGFGWLNNPESHYGVDFNIMDKGYFESGIVVEDLLKIKGLLSFGLGIFYRYGAYAYIKEFDNFAFKIDFRVPIQN